MRERVGQVEYDEEQYHADKLLHSSTSEKRLDLNRLIWEHKLKKFNLKFNVICPSSWLYNIAKKSILFICFILHSFLFGISLSWFFGSSYG